MKDIRSERLGAISRSCGGSVGPLLGCIPSHSGIGRSVAGFEMCGKGSPHCLCFVGFELSA